MRYLKSMACHPDKDFFGLLILFAGNLALQGRREEARYTCEPLLSLRNDVGLLSEEYDAQAQRLAGNFPPGLFTCRVDRYGIGKGSSGSRSAGVMIFLGTLFFQMQDVTPDTFY